MHDVMCMWARELHISHYLWMKWNEMNTVESINSSTVPRYAMHKILPFKFLVLNPIKHERTHQQTLPMRTKVNKMWNSRGTIVAAALCAEWLRAVLQFWTVSFPFNTHKCWSVKFFDNRHHTMMFEYAYQKRIFEIETQRIPLNKIHEH